jgi:hypothetical protein
MLNIAQQVPTTRQEQQIDVKINKIKSKRRCLMSNNSCTISFDSIALQQQRQATLASYKHVESKKIRSDAK